MKQRPPLLIFTVDKAAKAALISQSYSMHNALPVRAWCVLTLGSFFQDQNKTNKKPFALFASSRFNFYLSLNQQSPIINHKSKCVPH